MADSCGLVTDSESGRGVTCSCPGTGPADATACTVSMDSGTNSPISWLMAFGVEGIVSDGAAASEVVAILADCEVVSAGIRASGTRTSKAKLTTTARTKGTR